MILNRISVVLLFFIFPVVFVGVTCSVNKKSSNNSLEELYLRIKKEKHFKNETKDLDNEVRNFVRSVLEKIFPSLISISSKVSISKICSQSLVKYISGLFEAKGWALEMFDATSKPPSGFLEGTLSELGSFDQCLDIELPAYNGSVEFSGQYCAVEINQTYLTTYLSSEKELKSNSADSLEQYLKSLVSEFDYSNFRFGVCVPSKCTQEDISHIADQVAKILQIGVHIPKCYVTEPVVLNPVHIATICTLCFFLLMCVYGSIVEYRLTKSLYGKKKCNGFEDVMLCFSLISNHQRLISPPKKSDRRNCLVGMRALTVLWVMLGHNYAWTNFLLARRPKLLNDAFNKLEFSFIINSWLTVEPFFIISGVLTSSSVLKILHFTKGRINVFLFVLRRYFRNLVLLLMTVGLAFFMPVVSSGPFWYAEVDCELNNCVQRWWTAVLFISNWFSMKDICISTASWYISADLQLHAVSLIFLYPLYKFPRLGLPLVVLFIIICCTGVGAVTYILDLPPIVQITSNDKLKVQDTIDFVHLRPFTHAGPYYVGVIVGYITFKDKTIRISKTQCLLGWSLSSLLALTALYGAHNWNGGPSLTAVFAAVHRTSFAISVSWVIFVCITGNSGLVDRLLSSSLLICWGRLAFMIFLLHSLVFWVRKGSVRERMFLSHYNLLYEYIGNAALTIILAIPCHLLFEAPIIRLDGVLFPEETEARPSGINEPVENESTVNPTVKLKKSSCACAENMQNIYINYSNSTGPMNPPYKTVVYIESNHIG